MNKVSKGLITMTMMASILLAGSLTAQAQEELKDNCLMAEVADLYPAREVATVLQNFGVEKTRQEAILAKLQQGNQEVEDRLILGAEQTDPNPLEPPMHAPLLRDMRKKIALEVFSEILAETGVGSAAEQAQLHQELEQLRSERIDRCLLAQ